MGDIVLILSEFDELHFKVVVISTDELTFSTQTRNLGQQSLIHLERNFKGLYCPSIPTQDKLAREFLIMPIKFFQELQKASFLQDFLDFFGYF